MRLFFLLVLALTTAPARAYDPMEVGVDAPVPLDLILSDSTRGRQIPLRVYLPASQAPAPVVLFSHGLGGSREGSSYLGKHWAQRGFVGVFLQHPGSDTSVWKDQPRAERMAAMRQAASAENLRLRVDDVRFVLGQLETSRPLAGRLNLQRVGMSGHSFGAVTTQHVSGQNASADPRIRAAVIMSPSSPRFGNPEKAFGQVTLPWMLMTGTRDLAPIGATDLESRLAVYPALPPGDKYELVLKDGEHSAFTERESTVHHPTILALSTAFWDAYLKEDKAALEWLQGAGAASALRPGDRWRLK